VQDISTRLNTIQSSRICSGNSVEDFEQIAEQRGGTFKDTKGQPAMPHAAISFHIGNTVATINAQTNTIHHYSCQLLLLDSDTSTRCTHCNNYRADLCVQEELVTEEVNLKQNSSK